MRNKGQEIVAELMGEAIKIKEFDEWSSKRVEADALRFKEKVRQDRIRCGLQLAVALFLLVPQAHAYPAGTCTPMDAYYKNITFQREAFSSRSGAEMRQIETHGILLKEHDEESYSVIYNDKIPAPDCQYNCSYAEESND